MVKFRLDTKNGLLPGMYAKVYVKVSSKKEVVIPYNAITSRGGIIGVFVAKDSRAMFRSVKIVSQDDNEVAILGVKAGEEVVILPPADMTDGTSL